MRRSCSVLNPSLCSWFVFVAPLTCFAGAVPVVEIPAATAPGSTTVRPVARVETQPVPHARDAADTPAIWVHPTHPEKSLVLGTDKRGGLMVYNLDGSVRQLVSDGALPNDVDVLYDFPLDGKSVDLALAGCRAPDALGVKVWVIDPGTDTLSDATEGGMMKRGTTRMTFAEAIEQFCADELACDAPEHGGLNFERLGECAESLRNRLDEAVKIALKSRCSSRLSRRMSMMNAIAGRMCAMYEKF